MLTETADNDRTDEIDEGSIFDGNEEEEETSEFDIWICDILHLNYEMYQSKNRYVFDMNLNDLTRSYETSPV